MNTFDKRQEGFERKFAHDAETKFKIEAKRNRLLAAWASEKLNIPEDQRENYAKEIIRADFQEPGDEDVFRKIRADFDEKNIHITDDEIRDKMKEMMEQAIQNVTQS